MHLIPAVTDVALKGKVDQSGAKVLFDGSMTYEGQSFDLVITKDGAFIRVPKQRKEWIEALADSMPDMAESTSIVNMVGMIQRKAVTFVKTDDKNSIAFDVKLNDVNKPLTIEAPK